MKRFFGSLVILLFLMACVLSPTARMPPLDVQTSKSPTIDEQPVSTSTQTFSPLTVAPFNEPKCSDLMESLPIGLESQNKLVIKVGDQLYLQRMENAERILFLSNVPEAIGISPSARMIYYYDPSDVIHFIAEDGKEKTSIIQGREEYPNNNVFSYVFADNHLFIERGSSRTVESTQVLNPFTDEIKDLPKYSDVYLLDTLNWDTTSRLLYNPSFDRVAYPTVVNGAPGIKLVDPSDGSTVIQLPTLWNFGDYPTWSLDGKWLAYIATTNQENSYQDEIFLLSAEGETRQLTHFSDNYTFTKIYFPSWSLDGRYIAFWVMNSNEEDSFESTHLAVVDTMTGSVKDFCSRGDFGYGLMRPVWSPDNQFVLVQMDNLGNGEHLELIIELASQKVYQVKDARAIGWLK